MEDYFEDEPTESWVAQSSVEAVFQSGFSIPKEINLKNENSILNEEDHADFLKQLDKLNWKEQLKVKVWLRIKGEFLGLKHPVSMNIINKGFIWLVHIVTL